MNEQNGEAILGTRNLNSTRGLTLRVTMWVPTETGHGDFQCRYQIVGAGDQKIRGSVGIDGIQATLLATRKIGSDLEMLEGQLATKFFIGSGNLLPDHGFPKFESSEKR